MFAGGSSKNAILTTLRVFRKTEELCAVWRELELGEPTQRRSLRSYFDMSSGEPSDSPP